jgi:hypothetical protein
MPGSILWQSGPVIAFDSQLSGTGEALTNGSRVFCSGDFYNDGRSGGPCLFGTAVLTTSLSGFGAAVQANQVIDLFLVQLPDGVQATASTSGLPNPAFRGSFVTPVSGNVTMLRMMVEGIPLMPLQYRPWIQNNTGQTLASGWSLSLYGYQDAYT